MRAPRRFRRPAPGLGGRSGPALAGTLTLALAALGCAQAPETPSDMGETDAAETPPNALTDAEREAGWRLLFDGETTSGWRGYNREAFPDTGWAVIDGALVVGATATDPDVAVGGDIVTTESFSDFDLKFEFMLSEVANSGVLYRVIEEEGAAIWFNAPEYQVLDDTAYIEMGTMDMRTHLTGDNYDLHASGEKTLRGPGEWNEGRIRIQNHLVEHWLNGTKTVEYELGSREWEALVAASKFAPYPRYGRAASGPIGLQDHGRNVWYRSIRILPLEPVSLFNGEDLEGWRVHGTERWYVEDGEEGGELVCESGPDAEYGYLVTEETYRDFDLTVEFRQEADGNSGVFLRSSVEGTTVSGWQAEVAPPGLFTGGIYESYGRGWLVQPDPELDAALRMGDWNTMRIRAEGDRVATWLNGTRMVDFEDEAIGAAEGSIALQIHDGGGIKVRWRNLRLTELVTPP
ncbi:3-keto-disaccharide hydrolase [Candidatus Palauibacter sp.]|uniref:3-keto-disaccharide hydrolase n=1 Tax=Candidatus Palauibacter sp. TaxID=3101350 RepID=UPI003B014845